MEHHEIELFHDELQALERLFLAVARSAEGMQVGGDVNHVTEIVGQLGRHPVEILRPPGIANVAKNRPHRLRHVPLHVLNASTLTRA